MPQFSRLAFVLTLFPLALASTACKNDWQTLSEFDGGKVTRGELRSAFKLMDGQPALEMQDRVLTDLSLLKITALEASKEGLDKGDEFQKRMQVFEKLAYMGALEQELIAQSKKKKFKLMELQFAYLQEPTKPQKRKEEAEDLAKKLNAASDSDVQKIILQKTENKRYGILGGFVDPLCVSCTPNPYSFITDAAAKADGKFVVVDDPNGFWIVRRINEKEYAGDDLRSVFEAYWKKTMRIARATLPTMPDNQERKEFESALLGEAQIEQMAKQQSEQLAKRESQGLLQKRIEERKTKLGYEALPGMRAYFESKDPKATPGPDAGFKLNGKTVLLSELMVGLPEDLSPDKRPIIQQVLLPYEVLKDDELKKDTLDSDQYTFLKDWNRNNQLAILFLGKQKIPEVTEQEIMDRFKLRQFDEFKNQSLGQVRDRLKAEIESGNRQALLKKTQDELSKKYNLKMFKDKLKGGEL
ncbi:MAG: hypothetical protein JNM27_08915 [Leptospirales bacterium]|nr:hypothetical protein [Leptospirales bacterium]